MSASHLERGAWIVGGIGLGFSTLSWLIAPDGFPHAWLAALVCWLAWPLGSLALMLIHALTGGAWGYAIRRILAAGASTLPLIVPGVIPILVLLRRLYPWTHPAIAAQLHNTFYLNTPFFMLRTLVYLLAWLALGIGVSRSLRHASAEARLARLAPGGLIVLALSVTFFAIDFTLSLQPHFKSSIYGLLTASEALLFALSIAIMCEGLGGAVGASTRTSAELGRLLLALLVLWAYLDFMQFLIVWSSDLPDEAAWYGPRLEGAWRAVAMLVAGLHFLLPFFALLWSGVQRSRVAIGWLAALLVALEIPRIWWTVIPSAGRGLSFVDLSTMLAFAGVGAGVALRAHRGPLRNLVMPDAWSTMSARSG